MTAYLAIDSIPYSVRMPVKTIVVTPAFLTIASKSVPRMIDRRFDKLLTALHTWTDNEGKVDKQAMSYSDCFDGLRIVLQEYEICR